MQILLLISDNYTATGKSWVYKNCSTKMSYICAIQPLTALFPTLDKDEVEAPLYSGMHYLFVKVEENRTPQLNVFLTFLASIYMSQEHFGGSLREILRYCTVISLNLDGGGWL